ncbi:MAG: NUDIX domain-containing protein [Balneolaceae bacterium]|nr:NUDIX domain-containing protein [Balneolaceae bacterium]MBO6547883.1 NUDIX domain-containing protein [Balneolaceae bacterium]MBO6648396.1 NUDIX domain-containing protein [Balneolaceae bacterium]
MSNSIYSGKLRVRVAGLLLEDEKLLLIRMHSPVSDSDIWTAPGGGVEFGETLEEALKREFQEETGLSITVKKLLHVNELLELPYHAIELFFLVEKLYGELRLGSDPEHNKEDQLLKEIRFFREDELSGIPLKPDELKTLSLF